MDGVFHGIEFGRIRGHQTKLYAYRRRRLCRTKLCQETLHFFFVRRVAVKKNVHAHDSSLVLLLNQVGKIRRNIFGLGRTRGLKKELRAGKVYGEQSIGAVSFFSSVLTVGRVFFFAQP